MSHRTAFLVLLALHGLYFHRVLLDGEVISVTDNAGFLAAAPSNAHRRIFAGGDHSVFYIPEIHQHLNGRSRAWLSTWNPHVELGRPTAQLSGLGKANLLTRLLALGTHDAFRLYTAFCVLTVFLTGVFFFAFLQTLDLSPPACLCAAAGLSLGVYQSCWLQSPMYISTICWTSGLLLLITLFIQRPSWAAALGISFATYSLFMTGYPQFVVMNAYVLVGWTLVRLCRAEVGWKTRLIIGFAVAASAVSGVAAVAPAYLDLALDASRSGRSGQAAITYALVYVQHLPRGFAEIVQSLALKFDSFWFGNPFSPTNPFNPSAEQASKFAFAGQEATCWGVSFTPFYGCLLLLSVFVGRWRDLWPWQAFTLACLAAHLSPQAHEFAVRHLGLHLSKCNTLIGAMIPGMVLCGYAADHLLRCSFRFRIPASVLLLVPLAACAYAVRGPLQSAVNWRYVVLATVLVAATIVLVWRPDPRLLMGLMIVSIFAYGCRLIPSRPLEEINRTSDLVEQVRAATLDGSRYAKCGPEIDGLLHPNQEAMLGLQSIHTYDPLQAKNYSDLLSVINHPPPDCEKFFRSLDDPSRLSNPALSFCGVGLIVTLKPLDPNAFPLVGTSGPYRLHRTATPPLLQAQLRDFSVTEDDRVTVSAPLQEQPREESSLLSGWDDRKRYRVTAAPTPTLLFVSQQYHPSWRAYSGRTRLKTVLVNGFFQGVIVPPNTDDVVLKFHPWVWWSWLPQAGYLLGGLACVGLWLRRGRGASACLDRKHSRGEGCKSIVHPSHVRQPVEA